MYETAWVALIELTVVCQVQGDNLWNLVAGQNIKYTYAHTHGTNNSWWQVPDLVTKMKDHPQIQRQTATCGALTNITYKKMSNKETDETKSQTNPETDQDWPGTFHKVQRRWQLLQ